MLFLLTGLYLFATIRNIKGQAAEQDMQLSLINGTSSSCEINNETQLGLCLDNEYYYKCNKYNNDDSDSNSYNLYIDCDKQNDGNNNCHDMFENGNQNVNISLYCMHKYLNITWTDIEHECFFSVYENGTSSTNKNDTLICFSVIPIQNPSTSMSGNNGNVENLLMHVFGIKITHRVAKALIISLFVAIVLLLCCFGLCCCSFCKNMCKKQKQKKSVEHQRYPQSSCNI